MKQKEHFYNKEPLFELQYNEQIGYSLECYETCLSGVMEEVVSPSIIKIKNMEQLNFIVGKLQDLITNLEAIWDFEQSLH